MIHAEAQTSIEILEENDFFIIVNKPAGVSVHNQSPSLVEFLTQIKKPLHFVNRLDQETSGLVVIAKKPELHAELSSALENGHKYYRALLRGHWKKPEKKFSWSWPITDKSEGRKNPKGASSDRKPSETLVKIMRTNNYFTEVEIEILTGRQHQIRKHSAIAEHPIVGDNRYNETKYNERIAKIYQNSRMQLHAEKIEFEFKNKKYNFEKKYNLDLFFIKP